MGKCRLAALHSPRTEPTRCTEHYQTIYARQPGAIAALTAGLHFDQTLLSQIAAMGVKPDPYHFAHRRRYLSAVTD